MQRQMEYLRALAENLPIPQLPTEEQIEELGEDLHNLTTGENGELAFSSLGDRCLDLFGTVNRDTTISNLVTKFVEAWNENPELCTKTLFNFRDIRGGKGERRISRVMLFLIKISQPEIYREILQNFVNLGYWKDVLYLCELSKRYGANDISTEVNLFVQQLGTDRNAQQPSLCAKWAPSEGSHYDLVKIGGSSLGVAQLIRAGLKLSPRAYRKLLSKLRSKIKLVESQMSQLDLDQINFGHVPSKAHMIYKNAFLRDANSKGVESNERRALAERYRAYLESLKKGEAKVNYKGLMPHEIVGKVLNDTNTDLFEEQWKAIRQEVADLGIFQRCVSIVDVSGSMHGGYGGSVSPVNVAIALGILISECAEGAFRNKVITFHTNPEFIDLKRFRKLKTKAKHVYNMPWGGSTNLEKTFDEMIRLGLESGLSSEEMPEKMFIFTDMQFDSVHGRKLRTFNKIEEKFKAAGYKMPQVICWNLRSVGAVPFTVDDDGVALLSGYSSELMKAVMNGEDFSPMSIFLNAVNHYEVPMLEWRPIDVSGIDFGGLTKAVDDSNFQ